MSRFFLQYSSQSPSRNLKRDEKSGERESWHYEDGLRDYLLDALQAGEGRTKKGPVFDTAIIAGVMAAKRTHELIPFCHPLALNDCQVRIELVVRRDKIWLLDPYLIGWKHAEGL